MYLEGEPSANSSCVNATGDVFHLIASYGVRIHSSAVPSRSQIIRLAFMFEK